MSRIETITIKGFKSIQNLESFPLRPINVLIGANGAGKSNFLTAFTLLNRIADGRLQLFVAQHGYADRLLTFGRKNTSAIELAFSTSEGSYRINLMPDNSDNLTLTIASEVSVYPTSVQDIPDSVKAKFKPPFLESSVANKAFPDVLIEKQNPVIGIMKGFLHYHFHDTTVNGPLKKHGDIHDNATLRPDGENLAAFLFLLAQRYPKNYRQIVDVVKMVAPFINDFILRPDPQNQNFIFLEWRHVHSDAFFDVSSLSDGTLRFICLATLLLQPNPPSTIILDEPELGLHPEAIELLASMIQSASIDSQIIVATQSVTFVNQFSPEDLVVVELENNVSVFKRPDAEKVKDWLEDYTLGEVWEKNIIGGETLTMIRVYVVVEGPTEESFVKEILVPILAEKEVFLSARRLGKPGHKGGNVRFDRVKNDVLAMLKQEAGSYCTTLIDYYGIDPDFPGKRESKTERSAIDKARIFEDKFREAILENFTDSFRVDRFIPYIQMYEFEGLLFSDPDAIAEGVNHPELAGGLQGIRNNFQTPEEINDSPITAPSKRILGLYRKYEKVRQGRSIAKEIGLPAMRAQCPHFNEWVTKLENLEEIE